MSFMSFFHRLRYGSYKKSNHVSYYEKLAKDFSLSPQHVYELAHGKKPQTQQDQYICDELMSKGILTYRYRKI